jgi:hypothetical protein
MRRLPPDSFADPHFDRPQPTSLLRLVCTRAVPLSSTVEDELSRFAWSRIGLNPARPPRGGCEAHSEAVV